ncbi:16S rRNA (uracil(1498)-N(3))-methyltransferase [Raineya orbicola]|jgi:16S rRNA (uracil1498-N3)-methyltransferase|uniref:Ribosomal RNA small subunit methyltransferase E n=1 Tax=Raineya orbicola TaxID=2016530 RepID=A0A2N3IF43_9BACT|nr:16S rRNA (uracil(1498)-N(3))-methyltransferase [Raineya orbicola]PKQ68930.1 RNA methyltransferase, RsmE family [Raineya orbicola]
MQLFYCPNFQLPQTILPEEEAIHCLQVLRKNVGEVISITDGKGHFAQAKILANKPKNCLLEILEIQRQEAKPYYLHIAIAPTKNIERMEWFVEKATEIGIDEISFLQCDRSERKEIRLERLQKVALQAIKQSKQAYLPLLNPMQKFSQFLAKDFEGYSQKWIAYVGSNTLLTQTLRSKGKYLLLIGAEGDFSEKEINLAKEKGFEEISLGKTVLRTETAGIVACTIVACQNFI